ncbi:MAG: VanZ family protein [Eubacteriales bacterium]|nr:VanZ family protein [Eubacteriales bacterium]
MAKKILKKWVLAGYLIVILFCMFLGFGRTSRFDSFQFSFAITGIPLWIPRHFSLDLLKLWIFSLGNLLAFIPFGVLIPWNLPSGQASFFRSLILFLAGITVLEALQMLTRLGSFDAEDILINTLGFLTGYAAWKFGGRGTKRSDQLLRFCAACLILVALAVVGAEWINPFFR